MGIALRTRYWISAGINGLRSGMKTYLYGPLSEHIRHMAHYLEQVLHGGVWKAGLAAFATFFTTYLYGDMSVLLIYLGFLFIDLILGIVHAKVFGTFCTKRLRDWTWKLMTHFAIIFMFGLVCKSFFATSGLMVSGMNWMLFFLTVTELASVVYHLDKLGAPVPQIVNIFISILHKSATNKFSEYIADPEMRRQIEEALTHQHEKERHD